MKWFILLCLSISTFNIEAQVPAVFLESSNILGVSNKNAALAKAIVDLNGDFRDDILTMDKDSIYLEIQLNDGQLFEMFYSQAIDKGPFTINVGDFDNDGLNDFLHSGFYDDINIFQNEGNFEFTKMPPTGESIFAQGSSLFDINNDGWLDAIITHDDDASIVMMNDGQGNLVKQEVIDFTTIPSSDNSGNYSAIWVDLNQDDQLDLYIAKCRAGVTDPTDPRRINMAFINNNGVFTEMAAEMNLDIGDQSWCTDSGDLDNDGDMDMILINHEAPHMILENKGNGLFEHHIDFTNRGMFTTYDLEVAVQDFNNDGWQDILIGGAKDYLLINEGNLQFTRYDNPFGSKNASAFGIGDLNSDGYLDAYISFGGPDVPSVIADETWINFGGLFNHFKCTLQGKQSNASGIGAKMELYGAWGKQVKWLNSGTAYGITNSLTMHFGLADATEIDSCLIYWPSGVVDTYYDLEHNTHYTAVEGECMTPVIDLDYSKLQLSCEDDLIEFETRSGEEVEFSNGVIGNQLQLNTEGLISANSINEQCYNSSAVYKLTRIPELIEPELNYNQNLRLCSGDILALQSNITTPITWQDGSVTENYLVESSGEYYFINANECDTLFSDLINIEYTDLEFGDSIIMTKANEDVTLNIDADDVYWFTDTDGNNIIENSSTLFVEKVISDTVFYFQVKGERQIPSSTGGEELQNINPEYSPENINATMLVDVLIPSILESFEVETDSAGIRSFLILQEGDTLVKKQLDLSIGINQIDMNIALMPGSYIITTDRDVNINTFGYFGPRLVSHSGTPVDYPFYVNNLIRINSSGFGNGFYYYLYNLKATPYFEECSSDIFKYEVLIDTTTNTFELENIEGDIQTYPNPLTDVLYISSLEDQIISLQIIDLNGKFIQESISVYAHNIELDLSSISKGMYVLRVTTRRGQIVRKIVKL